MVQLSERGQRMLDSTPDMYHEANTFRQIQNAVAVELDLRATDQNDLRNQLHIRRATWGLRYWEERLGLPTNENDSYSLRRSRVLSRRRALGNFSAKLVRSIAESFQGGEVAVSVDVAAYLVTVTFIGNRGVPEGLEDLKVQLENIVHAHLGLEYKFTYQTWDAMDARGWTWDVLDARALTWDAFDRL